ncbi:cytochrome P450 [Streptomyces violascens]|uniref:cytochrome P450 n=1 Tax=Streptomyces violascens TaxID=67381 RepID=UPI0036660D47
MTTVEPPEAAPAAPRAPSREAALDPAAVVSSPGAALAPAVASSSGAALAPAAVPSPEAASAPPFAPSPEAAHAQALASSPEAALPPPLTSPPHAASAPAVPPSSPEPLSLLGRAARRDPYGFYRTLREEHPLLWDGRLGAWLVSRYADVAPALGDPGLVGPRRGPCCGPGTVRCDQEYAAPESAFALLREVCARTAYVLARRLAGREEADLVEEFCRWLPTGTIAAATGLSYGAVMGCSGAVPDRSRAEAPAATDLGRQRGGTGVALLAARCADQAVLTGRALASLMANLLDNPEQLELVKAVPALIGQAWDESLRRNPPVHVVLRRAVRDRATSGGTVPAGAAVALLVGAANRDPARFADPDRFDLHRTTTGGLGLGPADCPAARVAELQAECAVSALLAAMPGLRRADTFTPAESGLLTRAPRLLLVRPS